MKHQNVLLRQEEMTVNQSNWRMEEWSCIFNHQHFPVADTQACRLPPALPTTCCNGLMTVGQKIARCDALNLNNNLPELNMNSSQHRTMSLPPSLTCQFMPNVSAAVVVTDYHQMLGIPFLVVKNLGRLRKFSGST